MDLQGAVPGGGDKGGCGGTVFDAFDAGVVRAESCLSAGF